LNGKEQEDNSRRNIQVSQKTAGMAATTRARAATRCREHLKRNNQPDLDEIPVTSLPQTPIKNPPVKKEREREREHFYV
jgi:hypothetical protein